MVDALSIGYAIKDRRAELGMTQEQLAQASGVSKRCIWSLELGTNPGVQLNKLTAVLDALGLELNISVAHIEHGAEPVDGASPSSFTVVPRKAQSQEPPEIPAGVLEAIAILTEGGGRR